jgi:ABC-type phosphate transport system, periplasmic component
MRVFVEFLVEWLASKYGILVLAVTSAGSILVAVVNQIRLRQQKVLSCRVRINSALGFDPPDAGSVLVLRKEDGTLIKDAWMAVVRVKNVGRSAIADTDYVEAALPTLRFPGRKIMSVDVTESTPHALQNVFKKQKTKLAVDDNLITLPPVNLNCGDQYKLVVVLSDLTSGQDHPIEVDGQMKDNGKITTDADVRRFRRTTIAGGAVAILLVGALAVALLFTYGRPAVPRPGTLVCVPGVLTVEGSSAFGLITTKLAGSYQAYCSDSTINVSTQGSLEGLSHLRDASEPERARRLALSDGIAGAQDFPALVPRPLAVVPYSVVANLNVPVDTLSLDQLRMIFTGQVSRWSEITGNPADIAEIRVVGRTSQSGSRRTLEKYVLGTPAAHGSQADSTSDSCRDRRQGRANARTIVCEQGSTDDVLKKVEQIDYAIGYADAPDAIQKPGVKQLKIDGRGATLKDIHAGYPFWTVEYVYSYGPLPASGSLATSFVDYLSSPEGRNTTASFQYHPCVRNDGTPEELCGTSR